MVKSIKTKKTIRKSVDTSDSKLLPKTVHNSYRMQITEKIQNQGSIPFDRPTTTWQTEKRKWTNNNKVNKTQLAGTGERGVHTKGGIVQIGEKKLWLSCRVRAVGHVYKTKAIIIISLFCIFAFRPPSPPWMWKPVTFKSCSHHYCYGWKKTNTRFSREEGSVFSYIGQQRRSMCVACGQSKTIRLEIPSLFFFQ